MRCFLTHKSSFKLIISSNFALNYFLRAYFDSVLLHSLSERPIFQPSVDAN